MANMRVHELAKELNISSKDITDMLSSNEKKYTAMSGLGENEINNVKSRFKAKAVADNSTVKTEPKKAEERNVKVEEKINKTEENKINTETKEKIKPDDAKASAEKKNVAQDGDKKHISQVYFPQNSQKSDNRDRNNNRRDNNGGYRNNDRNRDGNNGYRNNDRNGYGNRDNRDGNNGYRNNDRNGYGNRDNRDGNNNGYRNNDRNGYGNRDNRDGNNNGYRNNDRNGYGNRDNRDGNNNGYRNNDRNGYGNRDNRDGNNNGYRNNDRNGYGNRDNRDGNNNGYRNNDRNGYGNRDNRDGNNNGYRNNDRNGYGNRDNKDGNNGYRNNDRNGNNNGRSGRDGQGFSGARRNDRAASAPKEDFIFETKPDSRRPDSRKNDSRKNDRKKDNEAKENLKFANSKHEKKPVPKPEKKEEETIKQLVLPDTLTIKELADKMKVQPSAIVKKLFLQGKVVTINQEVDYDTAEEIALEFNCICDHEVKVDVIAELLKEDEEDESKMVPRPPVVCVMGHVDHGKTSLLDAIRETHVTDKESGGITQKIGAYMVDVNGQKITFLDTPGHEAFTAMRMRGAQATDIAILVVAADDGVMPQTIEAINHAKAAGVEIIVAVNKIDKPNANIEKVKQELTEYELIAEDWGGSTTFVPVSAHTKEGIDELLEMILLTAEVNELKANPDRKARGIVIEAELDKGRGPVATILVQKGTLRVGDAVAAGSCYGKIRAMIDDKGRRVKEATPSMPVEILGLNDVPNAGEIIMATDNEKEARNIADTFIAEGKKKLLDDTKHKVSLDALFEQIQAGNMKELDLIIKADVQGSVEAVKQSLVKLSNEEVIVKVIHGGVGNINESDVVLASASNAIIIGFNVKPDNQARIVAEREKVDLRLYSVIYNAIEDVEAALKGMLEPIYEEKIIGHAEIRQIFKASGVGNIAGAIVTEGRITRDSVVRITRDKEQIYEGPIATLKHFKDDVKEVKAGSECGMVFENFGQIQEGDLVEAHIMVEVPR
ncbi:MAG: translation initiation factor IF-2 [Lachnospira sp.]|nr:translation initiation factor IF-2 [Lachnospira sp.]